MAYINVNGVIFESTKTFFSASNMAFRQGVGFIETMLWMDNEIRFFEWHIRRLQQSLKECGCPDFSESQFRTAVEELIAANNNPGTGIVRGQFFPDNNSTSTHFLLEFIPSNQKDITFGGEGKQGLTLGIADGVLKMADSLSYHKSSSRLNYHIAKNYADVNQWDDAILLNQYGRIVESTIANIFWIKEDAIFTPPLSEGCVDGVFRRFLLMKAWGDFEIKEHILDPETLKNADEIFVTNAIRGIGPVSFFEGKRYEQLLTLKLIDALNSGT